MPTPSAASGPGDQVLPDAVDRARTEWEARYPEVDGRPIDVIGRITRISALALARFERELDPRGVTRVEYDVLSAIARADHPLRASEVTSVTGISGASTTKNVERLVKMGLVERERLERDGRVVLLSLTPEGRELVEEQFPRRLESERQMLDGLDDEEIETLIELLRRITRNVERGPRTRADRT
ncbi:MULTISPECIES: MarR family winged helix-turn-helix transcriptional regulator [Gordonia]|uniref:MarR family transcriptional regulator n=1 Tax=Gordonia amicalis TaxID=89053 RepID=A0AAE4U7J5_9ACTN|nr:MULTISPECIES: MarR family transcriptional regulator [Gordonia]MCR8896034.1 MarR family transcriptional regulator [Gordonia sp. GONU]MCZ0914856.1 MarR family transcriptional regulator [Gordonia amicalis]MCZ4578607.1 MarR family transcriptional regulator [Gordonia amicalis]MCZ4651591.1 MarR family transcriptional regulator [Gordonia amicalis]MDJ0452624.1 MarR family transcriptional regulator [Gordonia amicalis]